MKRPGYDLSWRSIHPQWSSTNVRSDSPNKTIDLHYPKGPSVSISNEVAKINTQTFLYSASGEKQSSDSLSKITTNSISPLRPIQSDEPSLTASSSYKADTMFSELRIITSQISVLTNYVRRHEKHDNESQDWKFVGMVIDRLCLVLFTTSMIAFTSITFFFASNFYDPV